MSGEFALQTERLQMRWVTPADAELMLRVWNDPAFIRHVGDRGVRTVDEALEAMETGAFRMYKDYGHGPYRVAIRNGDTAIGICGIFRREFLDDPDLGYSVLPEFCGQGYAFEASTAILEYARDVLSLRRVTAVISPHNEPSIRLIRKLHFEFERMQQWPDEVKEVCLYSLQLGN